MKAIRWKLLAAGCMIVGAVLGPYAAGDAPATAGRPPNWLMDFHFVDSEHGWALGTTCAGSPTCSTVVVTATTDGGRTWHSLGAPSALPGWRGDNGPLRVGSIRFADRKHGWVYGPAMFSTADGGRTWQKDRQGGNVVSFAIAGGSAWAIEGGCPGDSSKPCHYALYAEAVGGTGWQRVGPLPTVLSGRPWLARRGAKTGWILSTEVIRESRETSTLVRTDDAGRSWRLLPSPCVGNPFDGRVEAVSAHDLYAVCGGEPGAGNQLKSFAVSRDGGAHWRTIAGQADYRSRPRGSGLGVGGYLDGMSAPDKGNIWITLDRGTLIHSLDGGRRWRDAIPLGIVNPGDGEVGPVQFVDPQHGWVAGQTALLPMIFRTTDGGQHWMRTLLR